MTDQPGPTGNRRQFLAAVSTPAVAAALAGCPFAGGDDRTTTRDSFTPPDLSTGETATFEQSMRFGDRYAMALERERPDGPPLSLRGRFHGADHYLRLDRDGRRTESYVVDGDSYVVTDGDCLRYPGVGPGPGTGGAASVAEETDKYPSLTYTGRTTREGEELLVFDLPAAALDAFDEPMTYYVGTDRYFLRRLETAGMAVDYDDWGAVAPIEPPADCRTVE